MSEAPEGTTGDRPEPAPAFGPRGYLPERAAKRARKIVLREQMGVQWVVAAGGAAVLVLLAGAAFFATTARGPGGTFVSAGDLGTVPAGGLAVVAPPALDEEVVVVRAGGRLRAFEAPGSEVRWCPDSGRIEGADGSVWTLTGRVTGGPGASLRPVPVQAFAGELFLDADRAARPPAPAPDPRGEAPVCPAP